MDTKSTDRQQLPFTTPATFFNVAVPSADASVSVDESASIFAEDSFPVNYRQVPGYPEMRYIPYGADNQLPFTIMSTIGKDEVLSQNLFFNALTAYGAGVEYIDRVSDQPTEDMEIERFMLTNSLKEFHLEQCTDMKHFFFSVAVIILDRRGQKIVQVHHKDACYCRFEKADRKGRINHVFIADWSNETALTRKNVEMVQLLNEKNPLGHLEVLMGRMPDSKGITKMQTNQRKFAIVMRFPTPGQRYYPLPYYLSIFRGDWFDLKRLVGKGKKAKIRNASAMRYQVEINNEYWDNLIQAENITDPEEQKKRIDKEKENIREFVCGIENSGKMWITGYYVDSYGHEQHMVKINLIDKTKEGGDWSEDVQEASNMMCYGLNIHPNLVGATPGKSQSNNSGSDKRELFTLKQSLETAFHDLLSKVHNVIIYYNGWANRVRVKMPMVLLTTLDKHTDAEKVIDNKTQDPNS